MTETLARLLKRVTVNLTPKSVQAIEKVVELTDETRTDVINRAVQVYAEFQQITANGGEVYVKRDKDAKLQQLMIL